MTDNAEETDMGTEASTRERFEFGTYHLPEATRRGDDKLRFANDDESVVVYIDNAGAALTAAVKVTIAPARLNEQASDVDPVVQELVDALERVDAENERLREGIRKFVSKSEMLTIAGWVSRMKALLDEEPK